MGHTESILLTKVAIRHTLLAQGTPAMEQVLMRSLFTYFEL